MQGQNWQLKYLRTKEGKEVDFAIADSKNEIDKIIEVKSTDTQLNPHLKYFSEKYSLNAVQLVKNLRLEKQLSDKIKILRLDNYLADLEI